MDRILPRGAYWDKRKNRFKGQITINKKNKHLGMFLDHISPHILHKIVKDEARACGLIPKEWTPERQREYDSERIASGRVRYLRLKRRWGIMSEIGYNCKLCGGKYIHFHHQVNMLHNSDNTHYTKFKCILIPLCPKCHIVWHQLKEWLKIEVM